LKNSKNAAARDRLDRLVLSWRAEAEARKQELSTAARARIVEGAHGESELRTLPALFTPTRQLVVASALPLLLAGALLIPIDRAVPPPPLQGQGVTTVRVSKQGDQVHFTIANGNRDHYVSRSTQPDRFGEADVVSEGAYVDRLNGGESLVFYRID
jgi:hypothetical protein